jgi:2-C-methyl-D-erythritol 2,4-cyclodiphosphate synthase
MRVGIGYDIHRFDGPARVASRGAATRSRGAGKRPLKLGGITIPAARGLSGHSDADVLLHAVADAIFGAVGAPDLGEQFPPNDPRWRGADSRTFVRAALTLARRRGWRVGNLDATVVADAPKLTGHKARMSRAISTLLDVEAGSVSVKAKTTEGFAPGNRGIAAHAVVLLVPSRKGSLRR